MACVLGVLGGASAAAATASSGAQISWGTRGVPVLPANAKADSRGTVSSVSCPSPGNCSAVGNYVIPYAGSAGLLLNETGGQWSAGVEAVLPANAATGGQSTSIDAVSCSSAGNCSAVGTYLIQAQYWQPQAFLLTETAGVWSAGVEVVLPADGMGVDGGALKSISCTSPGNCSAVGTYFDKAGSSGAHGLLLTETAGSWAPGVELSLPADAYVIESLGSVSCVSAGNCTAVGTYRGSHGVKGFVVTETDGSWGPGVAAPLPADALTPGVAGLTSVSCVSAGNCTAVGIYNGKEYDYYCDKYGCDGDFESAGWLLTETAGSWSASPAPALPANAVRAAALGSLYSVSCTSPGNCTAVGYYYKEHVPGDPTYPDYTGVLLTETDGQWATGVEESGSQVYEWAASVSCISPGNCGAVTLGGKLLTQEGGAWTTEGTARSRLFSVSCTTDGSCVAAGYGVLVGGTPATITLNVAAGGHGSGSISSDVGGIDCGSTCSASVPAGTVTLTAKASPGSRFAGWSGGDCSGNPVCQPNTAIDGETVTANFEVLPWGSAAAVPGVSALNLGGDAQVTSISCAGEERCSAGGFYRDSKGYHAFVADESSGSWRKAREVPGIAALNSGHDARVTSISCASPGKCAAGGYYRVGGPSGNTQAFVVNEVSGAWGKAREVPGTGALNVGSARVTSISCVGHGNCTAGGEYDSKTGRQVFVADEVNGVWGKAIKVPGTGVLNSGGNASLTSISCGSPGNCAAGGAYSSGGLQAFVVHEKSGYWGKAIKVPGTGALNIGANARVASISCATGKSCAAGGTYTDGSGKTQSFVVNGKSDKSGTWLWGKAVIVPGTAADLGVSGFAQLTSISCPKPGNCSAVGQYSSPDGNQAFVASSSNGVWGNATEVPGIASLAGTSSAVAISCGSVGNCALTGSDDTAPHVFVAAETNGVWGDAASGDVAPLVGLDALAASGLAQATSISCSTAGTCAIGGSYGDGQSHVQAFITSP